MEESSSGNRASNRAERALSPRYVIQFKAGSGFKVVLEFASEKEMNDNVARIEEAGLEWERIEKFDPKFDHADLFMDLRSAVCAAQFDLEDWL